MIWHLYFSQSLSLHITVLTHCVINISMCGCDLFKILTYCCLTCKETIIQNESWYAPAPFNCSGKLLSPFKAVILVVPGSRELPIGYLMTNKEHVCNMSHSILSLSNVAEATLQDTTELTTIKTAFLSGMLRNTFFWFFVSGGTKKTY